MRDSVRPTLRALGQLGRGFPSLDVSLNKTDHPLVEKAQSLPEEVRAGGAERVLSLTDRVWFKVKTQDFRGAAGELTSPQNQDLPEKGWWLVSAGHRQADTPARDFYTRLEAECEREGKGTGRVSSDHLLPAAIDHKRWAAECATLAITAMRALVRKAVVRSAHDGKLWTVTVRDHVIGALVRSRDGDTYLAITAEGYYDPKLVAILLDAIPGVPKDDWIAEPSPVMGIEPAQGQVIYSAMLPPETLAVLLEEDNGNYL